MGRHGRRVFAGFGAAGLALGGAGAVWLGSAACPVEQLAALRQGAVFLGKGEGVRQRAANDCGPAALVHCFRLLGEPRPFPDPESGVRLGPRGCEFRELRDEAVRLGWRAELRARPASDLAQVRPPAVLHLKAGHYVVLESVNGGRRALVHDPALGRLEYRLEALERVWSGVSLEVTPRR